MPRYLFDASRRTLCLSAVVDLVVVDSGFVGDRVVGCTIAAGVVVVPVWARVCVCVQG